MQAEQKKPRWGRVWLSRIGYCALALLGFISGGMGCVLIISYVQGGPDAVRGAMAPQHHHHPDLGQVLGLAIGGAAGMAGLLLTGLWILRKARFLSDEETRIAFGSNRRLRD
jgi:hypothetical protein